MNGVSPNVHLTMINSTISYVQTFGAINSGGIAANAINLTVDSCVFHDIESFGGDGAVMYQDEVQ